LAGRWRIVDAGSPTRVVVVLDDCELVVDGVRAGLALTGDEWLVTARSQDDLAGRRAGDVVLWDPGLERGRVDRTGEIVHVAAPATVLAFSWTHELPLVMESLRLGCAGYLLKTLERQELAEHLRAACRRVPVIDHRISGELLAQAARLRDEGWWPGEHLGLSRRESEILTLLVDGLDTAQISASLFLGRETVRTHLRSLYAKLGVGGRAQAVARAYDEGIVLGRAPRHGTLR
jgi:DNA-binding NarL/FixJ family response regulator